MRWLRSTLVATLLLSLCGSESGLNAPMAQTSAALVKATPPPDGVTIRKIQPEALPSETRLTVEFDQAPRYNVVDSLQQRGYFYIDIYGLDTTYRRRLLPVNDGRVRAIDCLCYPDYGVLRLVFYAMTPTVKFDIQAKGSPAGMVVSVWNEGTAQANSARGAAAGNYAPTPKPGAPSDIPSIPEPGALRATRSGAAKTVIIDPGHGGANSGAHSNVALNGATVWEKNLTLQFAYHLKKLLDQTPNIVALVTRTDDRLVSLEDRVKFAEANDGDLFISIHMNDGAGNNSARGMEIYFLNDKGTVAGAMKAVEERENRDVGVDSSPMNAGSLVRSILTDMERRRLADFRYESYNVCRVLERTLLTMPYFAGHNRGVKSANFVVLKNFKMPAILFEVGFITNADEVRYLGSPEFQSATAAGMFNAINDYFAETDATFRPNRVSLPGFDSR